MNKSFVSFVFALLVSIPVLFGYVEILDATSIKDAIFLKDEASFNITIQNTKNSIESFEIFLQDDDWILRREPFFTSLSPSETRTFTIYLIPKTGIVAGPKGIDLIIKSQQDENVVSKKLYVYISPNEGPFIEYVPSVKPTLKVNDNNLVDPRNPVSLKLELKNRNPLVFEKLDIIISSKNLNTQRSIKLGSFEETTEYFDFTLDKSLFPQKDTIRLSLIKDNKTFETLQLEYEVISYSSPFIVDVSEDVSFLSREVEVIFSNDGNIDRIEEYKIPVNWYSRFFYETVPSAQLRKEGRQRYYVWSIEIGPHNQYNIHYSSDFKPIFYLGLILLISIVLYFVLRSPIIAKKEVYKVQEREGGLYELKVILFVKNRSRKVISNLQISDRVSRLSEVIRDSYLGSLKPDKIIREENKGTFIKWIIPNVEPYEERIITYKIRSKFTILGRLSLPPARIRFITKSGNVRVTKSNQVSVES